MVSFDVSSPFTMVPVNEALEVVEKRLNQDTLPERTNLSIQSLMDLLNICLRSTYFLFNNTYYQQDHGAAMGSLSPIIANIFVESFEEMALQSTNQKPSLWIRYVDDTLILWPHDLQSLNGFRDHLNSLRPTIKFTMEIESDNQLPFLEVVVKRDHKD